MFINDDYGNMGFGNFVLAIIYFGCACGAFRQCCCRKETASGVNLIRRYFDTSLLFGCLVRSLAFATVFILSQSNSALTSSTAGETASCIPIPSTSTASDQQKAIHLFSKVLFVLTNLPDMMIMSSFALFFLVWMEVFQASRHHWHSDGRAKRRWMFYYLMFNIILYSLQVVLYGLIFFGNDDTAECVNERLYENIINFTVASIDVALPAMFVLVWICFTLMYAGFPYRSNQAAYAADRLTKVTACWCAGRLVLGYFQFASTLNPNFGKDLPPNDHSMIILSVLVVCDILPICLSLTGSVGILLDGADEEENRVRGYHSFVYQEDETSDENDVDQNDNKKSSGGSSSRIGERVGGSSDMRRIHSVA
jgi:hypothetical protein